MTKGIESEAKLAEQKERPIKMGVRVNVSDRANSPLISVIVPVYNTKSTLERCVRTILLQVPSRNDFEVILVDDGSPDGAGELCDQLAKQHQNIRVLHQKNAGLSAARNAGIKLARGEYITFVDSDDTVTPYWLNEFTRQVVVPVRIGSFAEVNSSGIAKSMRGAIPIGTVIDSTTMCEAMSVENCLRRMLLEQGFTMSACGKLYHRDLFKTIQFPVGKLYEDVDTTYRLIMQCPQYVSFSPVPIYYYHQNADSIIHQNFNFHKLDLIELTDQMCDDIDAKFPNLQNVTNLRRMHARFSILRQIVLAKPAPEDQVKFQQVEQEITSYLLQHKNWVLHCPDANRRDRLAMRSLLLGRPVFKLAWKLYNQFR